MFRRGYHQRPPTYTFYRLPSTAAAIRALMCAGSVVQCLDEVGDQLGAVFEADRRRLATPPTPRHRNHPAFAWRPAGDRDGRAAPGNAPAVRPGGRRGIRRSAGCSRRSAASALKCLDPALHQPGFLWGGAVPSMPTCLLICVMPTSPSAAMTAPPVMSQAAQIPGGGVGARTPSLRLATLRHRRHVPPHLARRPAHLALRPHRGQMERPPATRRARRRGPLPVPSAAAGSNHLDGVTWCGSF